MFNDTSAFNTIGSTLNSTDAAITALQVGGVARRRRGAEVPAGVGAGEGAAPQLQAALFHRRRSLALTLVPGSSSLSPSKGGNSAMSLNILVPTATLGLTIKTTLTSLTPSDLAFILTTLAAVAGSSNTSSTRLLQGSSANSTTTTTTLSVIPGSVQVVSLKYTKTGWALFLEFLLRNIYNVCVGVGVLILAMTGYCGWRVWSRRRKGAAGGVSEKEAARVAYLNDLRGEHRWKVQRGRWRWVFRRLRFQLVWVRLLEDVRQVRAEALLELAGKRGGNGSSSRVVPNLPLAALVPPKAFGGGVRGVVKLPLGGKVPGNRVPSTLAVTSRAARAKAKELLPSAVRSSRLVKGSSSPGQQQQQQQVPRARLAGLGVVYAKGAEDGEESTITSGRGSPENTTLEVAAPLHSSGGGGEGGHGRESSNPNIPLDWY